MEMQELLKHLPEEFRKLAEEIMCEANVISNTIIHCALDAAVTASGGSYANFILRCHIWLCISGFRLELQQYLNQKCH